jgi:hypothetical protein
MIHFRLLEFGLKSVVFCELSYTYCENEKIVYLTIHQSRKYRKVLYQFIIHDSELDK